MAKEATGEPAGRRTRVDAQRNRERILEVAREAFTEHGSAAAMDDIARRAEVGAGTLYRHFATREVLIEAVFRSQVEKLTAAAQRYAGTMRPVEALREWMMLFIEYVACKLLILPAMDTVPGGSERLIAGTRGKIHGTFRGLVERAVESGELRAGTDPDDMIRVLIGVFHTTALPGWESGARRIVDILIAGTRA